MFKLGELYTDLAFSVLNNTGVVNDDTSAIEPEKKAYITRMINEGLTRLHSRFVLKTDSVFVEMRESRTEYPLLSRFAFTQMGNNSTIRQPFILDSFHKPFEELVVKILMVYDSAGCRRILNDRNDCHSLFTPRPDTLQCIRPKHCEVLSVMYQAKHPVIVTDDVEQEIDLPDTLRPALNYWVGYTYYTGLNTAESTGKAAEYLQMYESICKEVEDFDLANSSQSTTEALFEKRGWV